MIHQNLSEHAGDRAELYRLWDNDLKKMMRRRQFYEAAGFSCLLGSAFAWYAGNFQTYLPFLAVSGVFLMFTSLKMMIDESNINYIMHQWDLQNALEYFRRDADTSWQN
jgi:hypothetical protein